MTVWINQKEHQYDSNLTIFELLQHLGKSEKTGIAIAINNSIIPKNNWNNFNLKEQDKVTIITATQGG